MPSYKISDVYNLLKRHQSTLHTSNNYKMFWFLQYFIQKIWMKYFSCPKWQLTQRLIDRVLPCTGHMKDSAGLPHWWTHNFLWQVLKSVDPSTMLSKGVLTAILSCLQLFNSCRLFLVTSHCKRSQTVTGCLFSQLKFLTTRYCDILRKIWRLKLH